MIIAVDFDGTIVEHKYPEIGRELPFAIETLKKLQQERHRLILWSVREGKLLQEAVDFCRERGLEFYAVNSNYAEETLESNHYSRKLKADLFIDDRNLGFMVNGEVVRNGDASLFTRERRLLESSGVRVSDGPSPVIKALPARNDAKPKHAIISLDHVTHRYGQGGNASPALDDVSLDIEQGAFVGLIGRNGSGKTTLAKHLNGLIQPTQGIVNVDGLDVSKHSVGEMAAHVGFVFQNPDHQIFCSSTKEEIAFGPTALGLDAATVFKRVDEMMTLFDLHRYEDVSPATLGYGERRAVALSSVIAMRTPILVLDEPTAGLDHRLASRFLGTVEKLNRHGVTVIMISHDMRAVYRYCTHVLELEDGHIVQYGPIDKSQEAQQSPARQARQPYKSRGPVSATHVLLKIAKDECDKEER